MSLALVGVDYRYPGAEAGVAGIDLTVGEGELIAVIGASGSGKTTLLRLVAGFLRPDRGRIEIDGRDASDLPPSQRELGIVFQSYALFPHMSAWENVAYGLKLRGIATAERRRRAHGWLERVGLAAYADRAPATLSGGQQQRVALARALAFGPRALLLDEPLSALDAAMRLTMRDDITRLQREHGIATLHVTHDQEEALSMADRVVVMAGGRILQAAAPRELYDRPASRAVAAFVGHANLWPAHVSGPGEVRTEFGPLATPSHGLGAGTAVTVLVRPEDVEIAAEAAANLFAGRLARDRFLGAVRRYDLDLGRAVIQGETRSRDPITSVHIPPERIRLLTE